MADQKIQLIIEAYDKTKDAFASLDKAVKGVATGAQTASASGTSALGKLKESWMGLSATAVAAWMAIEKAMSYIELGARALQAEDAFAKTAKSMDVNAGEMLDAMKKASAGTVDESHLMQKALKAMAQDVDPAKIPALFDAARVGAVKAGEDITNVADSLIDAIANQMPRGLRRFGLVTKDEFSAFNKAVAAGADNLNILDLVLNNSKIQAAKMGVESYNAAIALQKFKAEVEELKETLGKGIIGALEKLWNMLKVAASAAIALAVGMKAVGAAKLDNIAREKEEFYNKYAPISTPEAKNKMLADWQTAKYQADQAWLQKEELQETGRKLGVSGLEGLGLRPPEGDSGTRTQADLDKEAVKAKADNEKLLAEWKRMGQSKAYTEAQRTAMQADIQIIKSALDQKKESYKLDEAVAEEHYKSGLDDESAYIAEKQRLEKAALTDTLDALAAEKAATETRYKAMIGAVLPKQDEEKNKLLSEQKKEIARIDGEAAKVRIDLQIADKKNDIDAIERKRKLADVSREGALSLLQDEVKLRTQLNSLQVERGDMTVSEATATEIEGNRSILELQRQQIEEKINAGGLTDEEDAKLENQLTLINGQLYSLQAVTAEELKRLNATDQTLEKDRERLSNTYKLREELAKSTADYQTAYDMQKRTLEIERERALTAVKKTYGYTQEDIDAVNKYYDNLTRRVDAMKTPLGALKLTFEDLQNKWQDIGQNMVDLATSTAQAMQQAFSDIFFDAFQGKLKSVGDYITSFVNSVNRAIANYLANMAAAGLISSVGKLIGNAVGSGMSGSSGASETSMLSQKGDYFTVDQTLALGKHTGGMGYESPTFYRVVPSAVFLNAPRYHTGIGPGERAAIIRDEEGVFTPGQMAALGRNIKGSEASVNIVVNIDNQSGTQIETEQKDVRFDHEQLIINVIAKKAKSSPDFRNMLASGGRGA